MFAAITLPDDVQSALDDVVSGLRNTSGLRWTAAETRHLTLRFFGDGDPVAVAEALREVPLASFELTLRGVGRFPPEGPVRVAWVGVDGDLESLRALATAVDDAAIGLGFASDKMPFHPHITIGRAARSRRNPRQIPDIDVPPVAFPVAGFTLFASELGPGGPTYRVVERYLS